MGGYIGSSVGNVANAAERKQTYSITTATTSLTGLAYTPTKVHVFHNGVRLVDSTDYTATNGTSITLTNAAQNGDEVVVISYPSFQTSDTVSAANGGTFAGNVAFSGTTTGLDVNGTDLILDADGDSKIEASTDDTITVHTAGSEAMRIDSSGNVGIGENSPDTNFHIDATSSGNFTEAMRVSNTGGGANEGNYIQWEIANTSGYGPRIGGRREGTGGTGLHFYTGEINGAPTERMRIDHDGNLLLGTASDISTGQRLAVKYSYSNPGAAWESDNVSAHNAIVFKNPNGTVGTIRTGSSATSFNTSSDYRLKENVTNVTDGITRVKQLAPKRFNFIADADTTVDGFLAHEAQAVVPEAVHGTKDEVDDDDNAVMQGIDQSKLVPLLTAALQEAIAKIETLETKVAALEAE